jgi:hypothetical protein
MYKLRKAPNRDLYWVVAEDGTKKSKEPIPKARAERQIKALLIVSGKGVCMSKSAAVQPERTKEEKAQDEKKARIKKKIEKANKIVHPKLKKKPRKKDAKPLKTVTRATVNETATRVPTEEGAERVSIDHRGGPIRKTSQITREDAKGFLEENLPLEKLKPYFETEETGPYKEGLKLDEKGRPILRDIPQFKRDKFGDLILDKFGQKIPLFFTEHDRTYPQPAVVPSQPEKMKTSYRHKTARRGTMGNNTVSPIYSFSTPEVISKMNNSDLIAKDALIDSMIEKFTNSGQRKAVYELDEEYKLYREEQQKVKNERKKRGLGGGSRYKGNAEEKKMLAAFKRALKRQQIKGKGVCASRHTAAHTLASPLVGTVTATSPSTVETGTERCGTDPKNEIFEPRHRKIEGRMVEEFVPIKPQPKPKKKAPFIPVGRVKRTNGKGRDILNNPEVAERLAAAKMQHKDKGRPNLFPQEVPVAKQFGKGKSPYETPDVAKRMAYAARRRKEIAEEMRARKAKEETMESWGAFISRAKKNLWTPREMAEIIVAKPHLFTEMTVRRAEDVLGLVGGGSANVIATVATPFRYFEFDEAGQDKAEKRAFNLMRQAFEVEGLDNEEDALFSVLDTLDKENPFIYYPRLVDLARNAFDEYDAVRRRDFAQRMAAAEAEVARINALEERNEEDRNERANIKGNQRRQQAELQRQRQPDIKRRAPKTYKY